MKAACISAFSEIDSAFNCSRGSLGAVLGYGFVYGTHENQVAVRSAISEALEIVAKIKGLPRALDLALTAELKDIQKAGMQVPDWIQLFVKLETKLSDDSWQSILNFFNLGRSGVSYFNLHIPIIHLAFPFYICFIFSLFYFTLKEYLIKILKN